MSTRILNGYKTSLGLDDLLHKFKELVPTFQELKDKGYHEYLFSEVAFEIDFKHYKGEEVNELDALERHMDKHEEKLKDNSSRGLRCVDTDFSSSCCVFPVTSNKTLILFYAESKLITDHWESLPFIKDYHYQNSCDKPDDVSEREWDGRCNAWDTVLGGNGYGTPAQNGFSFTFTDIDLPFKQNDKDLYMPTKGKRALKLMHKLYVEEKLPKAMGEEKFSASHYFEVQGNWHRYKKDPEFKRWKEKIILGLKDIKFDKKNASE